MGKKSIAQAVLSAVGGRDNVRASEVCMTRLRLTLADRSEANSDELDQIPEVLGTVARGADGIEVVFGPRTIEGVHKALDELVRGCREPEQPDWTKETQAVANASSGANSPADSNTTAKGNSNVESGQKPNDSSPRPVSARSAAATSAQDFSASSSQARASHGKSQDEQPGQSPLTYHSNDEAANTAAEESSGNDPSDAKASGSSHPAATKATTGAPFSKPMPDRAPRKVVPKHPVARPVHVEPPHDEDLDQLASLLNETPSAPEPKSRGAKVLVINGPNINMLGIREPAIYGNNNFAALLSLCHRAASEAGFSKCTCFQSNHEGDLVDQIQDAYGMYDGIIINPGAYTHTSVAILDALKAVSIPAVEVHISQVDKREDFRQISYVRAACFETIIGMGIEGYRKAIFDLAKKLGLDSSKADEKD